MLHRCRDAIQEVERTPKCCGGAISRARVEEGWRGTIRVDPCSKVSCLADNRLIGPAVFRARFIAQPWWPDSSRTSVNSYIANSVRARITNGEGRMTSKEFLHFTKWDLPRECREVTYARTWLKFMGEVISKVRHTFEFHVTSGRLPDGYVNSNFTLLLFLYSCNVDQWFSNGTDRTSSQNPFWRFLNRLNSSQYITFVQFSWRSILEIRSNHDGTVFFS